MRRRIAHKCWPSKLLALPPLHCGGHQPGNLAYSPVAAGLVPIAMFLLQIVNLYMAINVGMARKVSGLSGLFLSPIARVGSALNRS